MWVIVVGVLRYIDRLGVGRVKVLVFRFVIYVISVGVLFVVICVV